jgi:hypothetical protein
MTTQRDTAWLIELCGADASGRAQYFTVARGGRRMFTPKVDEAIRFSRQEDALRMRSALEGEEHMAVVEHRWALTQHNRREAEESK